MKVKTAEELSDRLSHELAWRKKELSEVKALVEAKNVSSQRHRVFIRSGICLLYAHWEGFIKLAANSYLEYVRLRRLRYKELSSNFLALAMKEKLKEAKETNKPTVYIPICNFFLTNMDERASLPKDAISTASNLSSEILKEITFSLGLDFSPYSTREKWIDSNLLKQRNEIAHGEDPPVDREAYVKLHEEVIFMLDLFRNQIENAAIQQKYRRTISF